MSACTVLAPACRMPAHGVCPQAVGATLQECCKASDIATVAPGARLAPAALLICAAGKGAYGVAVLMIDKYTGQQVAVKFIERGKLVRAVAAVALLLWLIKQSCAHEDAVS